MAVTRKNVNGAFYFTYPSNDVFLKERNYFIFEGVQDDTYIKTVKIGDKTLNFGRYFLKVGEKFYLDVSAYYAKYFGKFSVVITYENASGDDVTNTTAINANTYYCYDPFKEIVPDSCCGAPYARIVPPNRMLWDGKKKTTSMLAAVRDSDYFSGYEYEMEGVPYETYRPSGNWVTTSQKNAHLGETYHNILPATGNLAELDGNGLPLWIEQGYLAASGYAGKSFEEQRTNQLNFLRTKTIFKNYDGLTIGAPPAGYKYGIWLYDSNKKFVSPIAWISEQRTLNNASTYPYIALTFIKNDNTAITPSELVGVTSSALTNPDAGKSYRWVEQNGVFSWLELTEEQIVNLSFYWNIYTDGTPVPKNVDLVNEAFVFSKIFEAYYVEIQSISPTSKKYYRVASVKRVVSLADGSMPYVYIRWLTPWGISVEHLFYLDTYATDKDDAQEVESEYLYEERSKHVIKGSFYLDNIRDPYDLWYYQTLVNSELVELYLPIFSVRKEIYMPNASDYVAVKITGSNIKDAVVDGVAQSTITFNFEMR